MPNLYAPGAEIVLTFTFKDDKGELVDPDSATFKVRDAADNITSYTLDAATRISTGVYTVNVVVPDIAASSGNWYYKAVGDGAVRCASIDAYFTVAQSVFDT